MKTYYKFLNERNVSEYAEFDYSDYLPKNGKPGKWLPKTNAEMCESGYHACEGKDIPEWANDCLYTVELRGIKKDNNKVVAEQMRFVSRIDGWNEKNLRIAAAMIVEQIALPIWNKYYPNDNTLANVVEVVYRYAHGNASAEELARAAAAAWARAAARDAAGAAAWARAAARDAAGAAARAAAGAAARDAAGAAAAAWDAAWDAALRIIKKQTGVK